MRKRYFAMLSIITGLIAIPGIFYLYQSKASDERNTALLLSIQGEWVVEACDSPNDQFAQACLGAHVTIHNSIVTVDGGDDRMVIRPHYSSSGNHILDVTMWDLRYKWSFEKIGNIITVHIPNSPTEFMGKAPIKATHEESLILTLRQVPG